MTASGTNTALHLSAPTSGPFKGIAIFQDPVNTNNFDVKNVFTIDVSGAIYMPGVDVEFKNALSVADTGCTLFIARAVALSNANGTLSNTGCAAAFGAGFFAPNGNR